MDTVHKTQVAVIGAGTAGTLAAIAAARGGAQTVLIERDSAVGGTSSLALHINLSQLLDRQRKQVIGGITSEILHKTANVAAALHHVEPEACHPGDLGYIMQEELEQAGVRLLLNTVTYDVLMEEKQVRGVTCANKSGKLLILADVVIDASGDADVAAAAGAECSIGRSKDNRTQAIGIPCVLGNVDVEAVVAHEPGLFAEKRGILVSLTTPKAWQEKAEAEQLPDFHSLTMLFPKTPGRQGEAFLVMSLPEEYSGLTADGVSRATTEAKRLERRAVAFLREHVPGFESSYLMQSVYRVGIRETRRIIGDYILTAKDIVDSRRFPDVVCQLPYGVGWDHIIDETMDPKRDYHSWTPPSAGTYDIPLRCLLPRGIEGMLVAGRCMSISHEALTSTRIIPGCMAAGEAAGKIAALSIKNDRPPRALSVADLQTAFAFS